MNAIKQAMLAITVALLCACAVGPDFKQPEPHLPAGWSSAAATPATNTEPQALVSWWSSFQEPTLSSLIERSTSSNLDLRAAVLRITEARTQREYLVATLQERVRLAYMRYNYGVSNLLEALDADRQLFGAELNLAQSRRDELLTVVQLYKALGGGWS